MACCQRTVESVLDSGGAGGELHPPPTLATQPLHLGQWVQSSAVVTGRGATPSDMQTLFRQPLSPTYRSTYANLWSTSPCTANDRWLHLFSSLNPMRCGVSNIPNRLDARSMSMLCVGVAGAAKAAGARMGNSTRRADHHRNKLKPSSFQGTAGHIDRYNAHSPFSVDRNCASS